MTAAALLTQLDGVHPGGTGQWRARCPAHHDHSPSLSIWDTADRILLHCFAGCDPRDIVAALGLTMADLFSHTRPFCGHRPPPAPARTGHIPRSFELELAALDRRLRATRILEAVQTVSLDGLTDDDLDQLLGVVACLYADLERAELLEAVADDVRMKEFAQRKRRVPHAA